MDLVEHLGLRALLRQVVYSWRVEHRRRPGAGTSTPITFTDEDFEEYNEVLRLTNESQQKEDIHILKRTVQKPCKSVEAAAVNQNQRIEVNNMSQWDQNETSIVPFDIRTTKTVINNDSGVETSITDLFADK